MKFVYLILGGATLLTAQESKKSTDPVERWVKIACQSENRISSIQEAAEAGDVETIAFNVKAGANVNQVDELGRSPLHLAAAAGKTKAVTLLIQSGADAMAKDKQGRTPAQVAKNDATKKACKAGEQLRDHEILAVKAVQAGNLAELKKLLAGGVSAKAFAEDGSTPLLAVAVQQGQVECAKILLEAGAEAETRVAGGKNLLMLAAGQGKGEIVTLLLKAGANPQHRGGNQATAMHDAVYTNKLESVQALMPAYASDNYSPQGGNNGFPITMAIDRNNAAMVDAFLKAGLKPNDNRFKTPLLVLAAQKGNAAMVRSLLAAGADKTARDPEGKTAADYANGAIADLLK